MKFVIETHWNNGYTCDCCRAEGTNVDMASYSGDYSEYTASEYDAIITSLKNKYPNSKIYRVAEEMS